MTNIGTKAKGFDLHHIPRYRRQYINNSANEYRQKDEYDNCQDIVWNGTGGKFFLFLVMPRQDLDLGIVDGKPLIIPRVKVLPFLEEHFKVNQSSLRNSYIWQYIIQNLAQEGVSLVTSLMYKRIDDRIVDFLAAFLGSLVPTDVYSDFAKLRTQWNDYDENKHNFPRTSLDKEFNTEEARSRHWHNTIKNAHMYIEDSITISKQMAAVRNEKSLDEKTINKMLSPSYGLLDKAKQLEASQNNIDRLLSVKQQADLLLNDPVYKDIKQWSADREQRDFKDAHFMYHHSKTGSKFL